MNDDDLLAILEGLASAVERVEAEQKVIHEALSIIAETAILTFKATGTKEALPDEIIDSPILERAVLRTPMRMPVSRGTPEEQEQLAEILEAKPEQISAEMAKLADQLRASSRMSKRIRIGHWLSQLNQIMKDQQQDRQQDDRGQDR